MQIQELIQLLEEKSGYRCDKSGNSFQARCPAHEDNNPSLSISENSGKLLIYCHAGCTTESVCNALGIKIRDLFNSSPSHLKIKTEYLYCDSQGKNLYRKIRIEPGKTKKKDFYSERFCNGKWIKGLKDVERVLYHLPEVIRAKEQGENVYLLEGEKDCDRLRRENLIATTTTESTTWREQYTQSLKGAHIVLLYDEDITGYKRRDCIIHALIGRVASLKVVSLPGLKFTNDHGSDISDWLSQGHTIEELKRIVTETPDCKFDSVANAYIKLPIISIPEPSSPSSIKDVHNVGNTRLTQLIVQGGSQRIQETGQVAGKLLRETGVFFNRGGVLVKIVKDQRGNLQLEPVKPTQFASEIELVAKVVKRGKNRLEATVLRPSQAQLIMDSSRFCEEIPEICLLSTTPVLMLDKEGNLRTITGYDKESRVLSFAQPFKSVSLDTSVKLLIELLSDFKFATTADKSRALAAIVTPALIYGQLIRGRSPLFTVEANASQTGKGYLVKLIAAFYNTQPRPITQRLGIGGFEESLNVRLIKGDSFISLDNMREKINSPALESLLTEDSYLARIPYLAPIEIDPKRLILFLTSNQCEMTQDLANRTCSIQLRKQETGYNFKSYPEGALVEHILFNWPEYFGAIITVVKEWVNKGCPQTNENGHSFRNWARTLDWIVQNIFKAPPLMQGYKETQYRLVSKAMNWIRSIALAILKEQITSDWMTTNDILKIIEESQLLTPGLLETDNLADENIRSKVLKAMGKELGSCFKTAQNIVIDEIASDEVLIDDVKIQRRIKKVFRGGDSGSSETKEYRFLRHTSVS